MRLTENELNDLKSEKNLGTSDDLLRHLKRNFRTYEINFDWMTSPIRMIVLDDKSYTLYENKKFLVNKLLSMVEEDWIHLGIPVMRRTIKKFLDGIK